MFQTKVLKKIMSFATVLKEMMSERNITQIQLAQGIGYSQRAVSKWVNQQAEPTETAIVSCAKFFGVSTDELLGIDNAFFGGMKNSEFIKMPDEQKTAKIFSMLSERGKQRVLSYSQFVLEEEKMK